MTGKSAARDAAYIGLAAALIAVCAWISVPFTVPFTMQTFGVFCALGLLGGKRGTLAVLVYILLGAVGAPVFSGFTGGLGRLAGPTGGYIVGFLAMAFVYRVLCGDAREARRQAAGMLLGLAVCYAFGTVWFLVVYDGAGAMGLWAVLMKCVVPFIVPDCAKLAAALALIKAVGDRIPIRT